MPVEPTPDDLAAIRATYAGYDADGRQRLWDRSNRGFDHLKRASERALVALLEASVPPDGSILDVGCGTGDLTALADDAGVGAVWTGIDLLPERIAEATARLPASTWVVGSVDGLPFDDRAFDVVAAITLFSSLPTPALEASAAREIARVIRPGGWLVWYDLRYGNPTNQAVHGVTAAHLLELFPHWAMDLRTTTVAPPIARRLGPLTPIAYPILHAIPPLRSHLIGRIRCPA